MFFCIDLVFATGNTRIINENTFPDIITNIKSGDYIISDAIIDPVTKNNVETYVLKDDSIISFSFANHMITSSTVQISNFYYRTYKNKNLIIRSREMGYIPATEILAVHYSTYELLKATGRLSDCLFKYVVIYDVQEDDKNVEKKAEFYFKFVNEEEFEAYKNVMSKPTETEESGVIKRPKKQNK